MKAINYMMLFASCKHICYYVLFVRNMGRYSLFLSSELLLTCCMAVCFTLTLTDICMAVIVSFMSYML